MIDEFRLIISARVMLGWSPDDLAERSGVGTMTLFRVEAGHENVRVATIAALQSALEKGGIKFTPETDTSGPGIRFSTADMMANERSRMPLVLRAARHLLGWQQDDLATRAHVGRNKISRMEAGVHNARMDPFRRGPPVLQGGGVAFI